MLRSVLATVRSDSDRDDYIIANIQGSADRKWSETILGPHGLIAKWFETIVASLLGMKYGMDGMWSEPILVITMLAMRELIVACSGRPEWLVFVDEIYAMTAKAQTKRKLLAEIGKYLAMTKRTRRATKNEKAARQKLLEEAFEKTMLELYDGYSVGYYGTCQRTVKKVPVIGWQARHFNGGESSKEARRNKISEDTGTEIPGMPNDLALAANSSFASLHTSDVPNCNLIKAKDKTTALHFNQQQSSIGPEVRIDVIDADNGQVSTTMLDGPSQENRFLHNGTSTLIPGGPSQQIRLANDNNNTILEDRIVMLGGPSREMSELERTSDEPEERINVLDDDDGSASSTDDDDIGNGNDEDDDDGNGNGNGNGNDEVQPQGNYFPDGTNDAVLAAVCQFIATIFTAKSPVSSTTALCAYIAVIGFLCNLFAALSRRRRPDIAKVLFRIGVSASAFTVLIGLGQYLPLPWHLNIAIPVVTCVIIAVVVALLNLD